MPKSKRRGSSSEPSEPDQKSRLLDVATEVFLESGYEKASTTEIAVRARASKQTLYSLYPSKEKLFLVIVARLVDQIFRAFETPFQREDSLRETLLNVGNNALNILLTPRNLALVRIVYLESRRFPEIRKSFYELGPGRALKQIESYLAEQKRQGTLHVASAKLAAEQFLDLLVGGTILRNALLDLEDYPLPSPAEQRRRAEATVDLFLHGCSTNSTTKG